jgi:hypothetical protein
MKVSDYKTPTIQIELPEGGKTTIVLAGRLAAKFFRLAQKAMVAEGEVDPEKAVEAVEAILPPELKDLPLSACLRIFGEAFSKIVDELADGGDVDEKKLTGSVESSPQS